MKSRVDRFTLQAKLDLLTWQYYTGRADQGRYDPEEARKAYIFWLGRDRIYSHP